MDIKNPFLLKSLQKTGFSEKEALVYVSLLELGGAYPSKIATYCGLKRSTTYNVLTSLSVRGLINEIEKRNKFFYQIEKPSKIIKYTNTRIETAKTELEKAEKILPELESIFSLLGEKPKVLFFEGPDTVLKICDDMISGSGDYEMTAFSNAKKFRSFMKESDLRNFIKSKEKLNITTRAIIPDTAEDRAYSPEVFREINPALSPKVRYMSAEKFIYEAEITLYSNNKVSVTKLGGQNVIGVIIEDKMIHDMIKMIFELAWNSPEVRE